MVKRVLATLLILIFIATVATAVISYSRGYRIDFRGKSINTTGILSASSYPERASIWIDGTLVSATNASLSLEPGWYNVRITKEGYQDWESRLRVQGEVVTTIDALLIPSNPSLRTLTVNGVRMATLSPSGNRVAYLITNEATPSAKLASEKTGVWMLELKNTPLGGKTDSKKIYAPVGSQDWENAALAWSPDEKTVALTFSRKEKTGTKILSATLLPTDTSLPNPTQISPAGYSNLVEQWAADAQEKLKPAQAALPPSLFTTLTQNAGDLKMSPDETKILYQATGSAELAPVIAPPLIGRNITPEQRSLAPGNLYIYDRKEDKNYKIADKDTYSFTTTVWYADSKHIAMVEKDTIYITDYDGTNKRGVYAGPFDKTVLYSWPAGGKLVILTNLNNPNAAPNFYLLDLT